MVPGVDNLVLAVSHAWEFQTHPDPDGAKTELLCELSGESRAAGVARIKEKLFRKPTHS